MKVEITRTGVTFESGVIPVGSVMTLPDSDGKRLIEDGYAQEAEDMSEQADQERVRSSLDKAYKAEELKVKAVELGMDPKDGVTKKDLIQAIIDAGLAESFL